MSRDRTGPAPARSDAAVALRRRLSAGILAIAALVFLLLEIRLIRSRGPIRWRAPDTVVTNGHPAQRLSVPFLRVLGVAREKLPRGATVAVIGPNAGTPVAPMDDLLAIGQLPLNEVVAGEAVVDGRSSPPQFLVILHPGYADDRYRLVVSIERGGLFERKP